MKNREGKIGRNKKVHKLGKAFMMIFEVAN